MQTQTADKATACYLSKQRTCAAEAWAQGPHLLAVLPLAPSIKLCKAMHIPQCSCRDWVVVERESEERGAA